MTAKIIFLFSLFATITSCINSEQNKKDSQLGNATTNQNTLTNKLPDNSEIVEINCDTIYEDKGISIKLILLDTNKANEPEYKLIFLVSKRENGKQKEIFSDTIESTVQEVSSLTITTTSLKTFLFKIIQTSEAIGLTTYIS